MGYEAMRSDGAGAIHIPSQHVPKFEEMCREKYATGGLSWVHENVREGAETILRDYGFTIEANALGGITVTDFEFSKVGSDWSFITDAISQCMEDGTHATWEMVGEDDECWRIFFKAGHETQTSEGTKVWTFQDAPAGYVDNLAVVGR